jgi:hypothetical protein
VAKSEKSLRLCTVKHKSIVCDGLCKVVDSAGVVKMCSVYVEFVEFYVLHGFHAYLLGL